LGAQRFGESPKQVHEREEKVERGEDWRKTKHIDSKLDHRLEGWVQTGRKIHWALL